jgi:AhpD family alkylhydroperoxidase
MTTPRIDLTHHAGAPFAAMVRLEERIVLDPALKSLVKVRVSQINGCAHCLDMHWAHAREHGESELRLAQLGAWQESPFFDAWERAALALAESMTHISATHVPDDVMDEAARHFDADELGHLLFAIGAINLWNRVVVAAGTPPASYVQAEAA